jgi:hypothetical protein
LDNQLTLSDELRKLVEARLEQTLKGINDTLNQILEKQEITPKELKEELKSLEENCNSYSKNGAWKFSTLSS